jgi:ABC-type branched-subunit amino acid transport system permease subunit
MTDFINRQNKYLVYAIGGLALIILPLLLQSMGNFWVRIADMALLYVLLAIGLNIVVGYAGLLDLGFVAFFAIGAYLYGLLSSTTWIIRSTSRTDPRGWGRSTRSSSGVSTWGVRWRSEATRCPRSRSTTTCS